MNYISLNNTKELQEILSQNNAVLVYFSHAQCNVCKVLKPKISELLETNYPNMLMCYADTLAAPELAGQNNIFSVPTVVCFFAGRETFRKSRNIGIRELSDLIKRPYEMVFE